MTRQIGRLTAAALAAIALAATATNVHAASVTEPGDGDKSCTALSSEIKTLSEREEKAAKRAASGRKLLGFAGTALQVAAPMLGGNMGGGQGGYIAQQALGAIQQQQAQQQMAQAYGGALQTQPAAAASVQAQRIEHLKSLSAEKAC